MYRMFSKRVVSLVFSWGYTVSGVFDSSVLAAIDYADAQGTVVVFAAGNDGSNEDWYPAYYSKTVAVAALDKSGKVLCASSTDASSRRILA